MPGLQEKVSVGRIYVPVSILNGNGQSIQLPFKVQRSDHVLAKSLLSAGKLPLIATTAAFAVFESSSQYAWSPVALQLTGTLPVSITTKPLLSELKVEHNEVRSFDGKKSTHVRSLTSSEIRRARRM